MIVCIVHYCDVPWFKFHIENCFIYNLDNRTLKNGMLDGPAGFSYLLIFNVAKTGLWESLCFYLHLAANCFVVVVLLHCLSSPFRTNMIAFLHQKKKMILIGEDILPEQTPNILYSVSFSLNSYLMDNEQLCNSVKLLALLKKMIYFTRQEP